MRVDAGISQRRLAGAAGVDQGHLSRIEAGTVEPTISVLVAVGRVLGADLAVRLYPTTGPRLHDRIQAVMGETVLVAAAARWRRLVEVGVRRPARGFIDMILVDPAEPAIVAVELQSDLRRIEQQLRWAADKAESLPSADEWPILTGEMDRLPRVGRVMVLRSTARTRSLAREFTATLRAAYPARTADVVAALTGTATWPGDGLIWCRVESGRSELLTSPPRGVLLGR